MTSTFVNEERKCSKCLKKATHSCKHCRATPNATDGQISKTWYCGPECREAHWTEHKAQCEASQARQVLYRAAATAKEIFYIFQEIAFMWSPGRIEKLGTTWLIHPDDYTGTSQLRPFPYKSFPDMHEQAALLSYQCCQNASSDMHNVVKTLLAELYSNVDEVNHTVKNVKHYLQLVRPSGRLPMTDDTNDARTILRVTMKNGEVYAFDMTGAQFGWDECIMPWNLYHDSRIREISEILPFGETRVRFKMDANNIGGQYRWVREILEHFAGIIDGALTVWENHNMSTKSLLRLPEAEIQRPQASLLNAIVEIMRREKVLLESQGRFEIKGGFKPGPLDDESTSFTPDSVP